MQAGARLSATIEVLSEIARLRRPAADALKEWGLTHRFAGSGDRTAIAGLVYDALRRRASSAHLMGAETQRAIVLGMLKLQRGLSVEAIAVLANGTGHCPEVLTPDEIAALQSGSLDDAPAWVRGDYPEWLDPAFAETFGEERVAEGAALASRAPLDLRVNTLKMTREEAAVELAALQPAETRWSPFGLRIALAPDARSPGIHSEPAFLKGGIEIQDEGSQLAALFAAAKPGEQVVDLCAGAGGKTLALAAAMENHGQLFATDLDKRRLAPVHARLDRAGVRNVQVRTPRGAGDAVADLDGQIDLVFVDAPCTGTGSWRRNPDAKLRLRPGALEQRLKNQAQVLDRATQLLKPGGRIAYVTCSVIEAENGAQVRSFLTRHKGFSAVPPADMTAALGERGAIFRRAIRLTGEGLLMTPARTDTDGFYVSILRKG